MCLFDFICRTWIDMNSVQPLYFNAHNFHGVLVHFFLVQNVLQCIVVCTSCVTNFTYILPDLFFDWIIILLFNFSKIFFLHDFLGWRCAGIYCNVKWLYIYFARSGNDIQLKYIFLFGKEKCVLFPSI